jgi:hypothetical protein
MYINIDIDHSIEHISTFLANIWDKHECKVVKKAMEIVMKNNRMKFSDLIYHQIRSVAMGMSPAPTIANLYVAIYKLNHITPLLDKYLMLYKDSLTTDFQSGYMTLTPRLTQQIGMTSRP